MYRDFSLFLCIAVLVIGESQAYGCITQNVFGFSINNFFNYIFITCVIFEIFPYIIHILYFLIS